MRNKRRGNLQIKTQNASNPTNPAPAASAATVNNGVPIASEPRQPTNGRVDVRERSFRRENFHEFYGGDDGGGL